jgi:molecular chaperone DnaK
VGIPPAPRGIPQIEVTFDIDVNGIVNVSAKDMGTGKSQSITITGSTRLKEEEIERMVKDAEQHSAEDKKRKEEADVKNEAEAMVYQAEKIVKDHGDKADKAQVEKLESAIKDLKEALAGGDVEVIKQKVEALIEPMHAISAEIYKQSAPGAAEGRPPGEPPGDKTVDADYEVK